MLSSNGISFSCWIYIKLKNFSSGWIIAKLFLQWIIWPCVVMPRESPPTFWLWQLSDCFVNVNSFSCWSGPRSVIWPIKKIKQIYSSAVQIFAICFVIFFLAESQLKVDQCLFSGKVLLCQSTFSVLLVHATIHLQKIGPFLQLSFQLFLHIFQDQTNSAHLLFCPRLAGAKLVF